MFSARQRDVPWPRLGRLAGHKSERSAVTHELRDRALALVEAAPEPLLVDRSAMALACTRTPSWDTSTRLWPPRRSPVPRGRASDGVARRGSGPRR